MFLLNSQSNDELLDQAWDDHIGESLDTKKVKEARQLEMEYYDKMHVFDKVPIAPSWERTGKAPLKARRVDIDKGTRYRSRWVAKQFKGSDSEEWFAATPPIEALRALISHTTSGPKKKALTVCDVSRVSFYAPVQDEIFHSRRNKFERFRGFLELVGRFEFEFLRRGNYIF